jgi:hypothetical protein
MRNGYPGGMRSVRTWLLTVALLLAATEAAPAATPPGVAKTIRPARLADHAARATMPAEWWTLRAIDPRTRKAFHVQVDRRPGRTSVWVATSVVDDPLGEDLTVIGSGSEVDGSVNATARRLTATAPGISVRIDLERRELRAELQTPHSSGRITLSRLTRGPAALGFDIGTAGLLDPSVAPTELSWSVPIATSTARGAIDFAGTKIDVDGWRGSYEHGWGEVYPGSDGWDLWDSYIVHRRRGVAWIVFGLNRWDTVAGAGARDAMWIGMLARATPRGLRACRPAIHRRDWQTTSVIERYTSYAPTLRARCRGLRATFLDRLSERGLGRPEGLSDFAFGRPATVNGRGAGWAEHRGNAFYAAGA